MGERPPSPSVGKGAFLCGFRLFIRRFSVFFGSEASPVYIDLLYIPNQVRVLGHHARCFGSVGASANLRPHAFTPLNF